jgi:hypothetical protein
MAQHISDEAAKALAVMKSPAAAKILDTALERRPSAKFGAGDYTSEVGKNPGASIDQSQCTANILWPEVPAGRMVASKKIPQGGISDLAAPRPTGQSLGPASIVRWSSAEG